MAFKRDDRVLMPPKLTQAMRAAIERVQVPITINDPPFWDSLYQKWYEIAQQSQARTPLEDPATEGMKRRSA